MNFSNTASVMFWCGMALLLATFFISETIQQNMPKLDMNLYIKGFTAFWLGLVLLLAASVYNILGKLSL